MRQLYLFVVFLVIYEFTTYVANDMIMPGMLNVISEFNAPINYVSLSLTFYILGGSIFQLFLGPLSEYFGKRRVILAGNLFFIIVSICIMQAHTIYGFMLGRLLEGTGLGFVAMGYALIHEKFDDKQAVKLFALMSNVSLLAPLIGPLLGVIVIKFFGWRAIFVIITILGIIAIIGLYKFIPIENPNLERRLNLKMIFKTYWQIITTPKFILGSICVGLSALPALGWIGLAPTILIKTQHLGMFSYAFCQLFSVGGLLISSILMQFIAGRWSFYWLIKGTCFISMLGVIIGFIFNYNLYMVVVGMFLYSFGLGIFNNLIGRLIMTIPNFAASMITSMMLFIVTMIFVFGIEIIDQINKHFGYSLANFTQITLVIMSIVLVLVNSYARIYKHKQWD